MSKLTVNDLKKIKEDYQSIFTLRGGSYRAKVTIHMGTCGIAAGARKVMNTLMNEITKRNIKDTIVTISGCAGLCSHEPMATIELTEMGPVKYVDLNEEKIIKILEQHVLSGKIIKEYTLIE
ncbi:TPA: NADP oxidoreductase [bacterium]|nr:NADP oxidoreductase [bacterium]